jgi:hypothetical protein
MRMGKSGWNTSSHYLCMEGNVRALIKHATGDKPDKGDARLAALMHRISGLIDAEVRHLMEVKAKKAATAAAKEQGDLKELTDKYRGTLEAIAKGGEGAASILARMVLEKPELFAARPEGDVATTA